MIYHLTSRAAWAQALRDGIYRAESLDTVGYIHFSKREQVAGVYGRFYHDQPDLVLLVVDPDRLVAGAGEPALRYEPPAESPESYERFPHLYGALNLDAVTQVVDYPPGGEGMSLDPP